MLDKSEKINHNLNMDKELLNILACPICKGKLQYKKSSDELVCKFDGIAFPIRDNVPVLLEEQAREIGEK